MNGSLERQTVLILIRFSGHLSSILAAQSLRIERLLRLDIDRVERPGRVSNSLKRVGSLGWHAVTQLVVKHWEVCTTQLSSGLMLLVPTIAMLWLPGVDRWHVFLVCGVSHDLVKSHGVVL